MQSKFFSKTISILGTGWLGLPLVEHFVEKGFSVKGSTTSSNRLQELSSVPCEAFVIQIDNLQPNISDFLNTDILIVNIPSKNIDAFANLIQEIAKSKVEKIIFVSSTSVYEDNNRVVRESDGGESTASPLYTIENLFWNCENKKTTIVRFGGLIGYSRNPGKFFSSGRTVPNPDAGVNLIHRDDCIGILSRIIEQEAWGEVFNCCADTHPTKREFYSQAARNIGAPAPHFGDSGSTASLSYKIISNEKVKQYLNYEFIHPDLMRIIF
ncbi:MAG: hypothetical protein JJT78_04610 [Leptospira sp.]|nr:hypothetical protein [Leptospira sp.]